MSGSVFNEDYFLRGKSLAISNYEDYRWLGEPSLLMADHLKHHLHMVDGESVLDFGCAKGYLVKALRMRGIDATGYDISKWAIENCDPDVKGKVSTELKLEPLSYDHITAKDSCEHIPLSQLRTLIPDLLQATKRSMLIIVPLTAYHNGSYIRKEDEADVTHIVRYTLHDWLVFLTPLAPNFTVSGSYHIRGIKPAAEQSPCSCGFITLQRYHQ